MLGGRPIVVSFQADRHALLLSLACDLGELVAATADEGRMRQIMEAVAAACREWGFFQVVNHGVAPELMRAAREAWRGFFRLPITAKQQYANLPRTYEGYGSRVGVQKGGPLDWGDYYFLHLAPDAGKSPDKYWPTNPAICKYVLTLLISPDSRYPMC
jgi:isopenicillin N synthase-like dioxygenase